MSSTGEELGLTNLPTSCEIIGNTIAIKYVRSLTDHDGTGCDGLWTPGKLSIQIDAGLCEDAMWATLFHEIFHAVLDMLGNDLSKDEAFVESVGQIWAQVYKTLE